MDALLPIVVVASCVALTCWVASLATGDHSWIDRAWSIVPVVYAWMGIGIGGADARSVVVAVLITLWGARLTFNFGRKGGYAGVEDYRWAILRRRMPRWAFELFNLFFIVLFQSGLLVAIVTPLLVMVDHPRPFGWVDGVLVLLFFAALAGEFAADQQQWAFQTAKRAETAAGRMPRPGFVTTGLWRFSRHPNFFFEQVQWWLVFLFGAVASGTVVSPTVAGAAALTALFIGSTIFTESITAAKYPEYAEYRRRTSMLVPWAPR